MDEERVGAQPGTEPGDGANGHGGAVETVLAAQLELAALHEAFLERQTALHVGVLALLAPGGRL